MELKRWNCRNIINCNRRGRRVVRKDWRGILRTLSNLLESAGVNAVTIPKLHYFVHSPFHFLYIKSEYKKARNWIKRHAFVPRGTILWMFRKMFHVEHLIFQNSRYNILWFIRIWLQSVVYLLFLFYFSQKPFIFYSNCVIIISVLY